MGDAQPGRFAYYQEELDALLKAARGLVAELKKQGHVQFDRAWLLDKHPAIAAGGVRFEVLDVLAAANYLGLIELDAEEDGWIRIL